MEQQVPNYVQFIGPILTAMMVAGTALGFFLRGYISKPDALRADHEELSKTVNDHIRACAEMSRNDAILLERLTNLQRNFDDHAQQDSIVNREIRNELKSTRDSQESISGELKEELKSQGMLQESMNLNLQRLINELFGDRKRHENR